MGNLNQFYLLGRLARAPHSTTTPDGQAVVHLALSPGTGQRAPRGPIDPLELEAVGPQVDAARALRAGQSVLLRGQLRAERRAPPGGGAPMSCLVARVQAIELVTPDGPGPRHDGPRPDGARHEGAEGDEAEGGEHEPGRTGRRRRRRGRRRPDGEGGPRPEGEPREAGGGDAPSDGPAPESTRERRPERPLPPPTPIASPDAIAQAQPPRDRSSDMPF